MQAIGLAACAALQMTACLRSKCRRKSGWSHPVLHFEVAIFGSSWEPCPETHGLMESSPAAPTCLRHEVMQCTACALMAKPYWIQCSLGGTNEGGTEGDG
jgi:hypothetical protein